MTGRWAAPARSTPELEFALMAAGVPPDKLYPIDIDKAFASYDKIKSNVVKWWETGAVPVQMLTDKEVVLTSVWNGRMAALQAAGVPAAISWDQGMLKRDCWAVPKGSPNKANAMKFIALQHNGGAAGAAVVPDPVWFVNAQSPQYMPPEQSRCCRARRRSRSKLVPYDYAWWSENRDAVIARWNKWIWPEHDGSHALRGRGRSCAGRRAKVSLVGLEKRFDGSARCVACRWRSVPANS